LPQGLPEGAKILHKTGDIGKMLGDAGIVQRSDGRKYIVTILVQRAHNDYSARTFINEASAMIYEGVSR
jgi:beta-lactamase class A